MSDQPVDTPIVPAAGDADRRISLPLVAAVLIAACLGALLAGQLGNVFVMPDDFANMPLQPSAEYMANYKAAVAAMYAGNYAIRFAIVGASIGAAIGLTAVRKNRLPSTVAAALGGAIAGAAGGYALGRASAYLVNETQGESITLLGVAIDPIVQTTALQCFSWSLVGAGIGLAWAAAALGARRLAAGLEGGLIGGIAGGLIYSVIAAIAFTASNAFLFIPERPMERIVWASLAGLSVAIALVYSAGKRVVEK